MQQRTGFDKCAYNLPINPSPRQWPNADDGFIAWHGMPSKIAFFVSSFIEFFTVTARSNDGCAFPGCAEGAGTVANSAASSPRGFGDATAAGLGGSEPGSKTCAGADSWT